MNKRSKASSSRSRAAKGASSRPARARNAARVTETVQEQPHVASHEPPPSPDTVSLLPAQAPVSAQQPVPAPESVSRTLSLSAECMVSGAASLKEHLHALLDQPEPVTLEINTLQRIDTAGLQVLTAFVRERTNQGLAVEWQGTAPVLTTAAQLLGLTSVLKLPA